MRIVGNGLLNFNNNINKNNEKKKAQESLESAMLRELTPEEEKVKKAESDAGMAAFMAEVMSEKSKTEEIASKIAKGENLSEEEMNYIEEKNPELLRKAKVVSKQRQELEREVKSAKTKKDAIAIVQKAKMAVMQGVDFKNEANMGFVKLQLDAIQKVEEDVNKGKKSESKIDALV